MRIKSLLRFAVVSCVLFSVFPFDVMAATPLQEVLIRCSPEDLARIKSKFGAAVLDNAGDIYLLAVNSAVNVNEIKAFNTSMLVVQNSMLTMSAPFQNSASSPVSSWKSVRFYTSNVPDYYLNQPAAQKIRIRDAHAYSTGGRTVVAIIDTGIDENHPVLRNSIVPGRNYVSNGSASEWNDPAINSSHMQASEFLKAQSQLFATSSSAQKTEILKGSVRVFLNASSTAFLDTSSTAFLDASSTAFLDTKLPSAFGHGTMVAGVIHLVAPEALLMPMKAFDANGTSSLWNIVRAIRDAAQMGAHVINMSFSTTYDPLTAEFLQKAAIDIAKRSNIALVASAGNYNLAADSLPAAIDPVVGVTTVNAKDVKATFSNYGKYVNFSSPGTDIITTYPGTFAKASGTSFSAPFVSGLFALLHQIGVDGSSGLGEIESGSDPIEQLNPQYKDKLGKGRINVYTTIRKKF